MTYKLSPSSPSLNVKNAKDQSRPRPYACLGLATLLSTLLAVHYGLACSPCMANACSAYGARSAQSLLLIASIGQHINKSYGACRPSSDGCRESALPSLAHTVSERRHLADLIIISSGCTSRLDIAAMTFVFCSSSRSARAKHIIGGSDCFVSVIFL